MGFIEKLMIEQNTLICQCSPAEQKRFLEMKTCAQKLNFEVFILPHEAISLYEYDLRLCLA